MTRPDPRSLIGCCADLLTCAHCGAILRLDSRAFAPVEHRDGLICAACDERELADNAEAAEHGGLAAFHRAFADTTCGVAL
jgi:hypothetical protein